MKLNIDELKKAAWGAVRVEENEEGEINFYRFSKAEEDIYKEVNVDFYNKSRSTSGVKLVFKTNSESLYFKVRVSSASSRKYFSFDIFVNGELFGHLDNVEGVEFPKNYTKIYLPHGEFSKKFDFESGEKTVEVYFPWSVRVDLIEFSIDDGATFVPVKSDKRLVAWGDSITQGYDSIRSYGMYSAILANALGAEVINRGIAAEKFFVPIAEPKEDFEPDYITVAYGTNDWNKVPKDEFMVKCGGFYSALSRNYPNAKIYAISPVWRADHAAEDRILGLFSEVEGFIRECVKDLENVTVIPGFDLIPNSPDYFGDLRVHPNDEGNKYFGENLAKKILAALSEK